MGGVRCLFKYAKTPRILGCGTPACPKTSQSFAAAAAKRSLIIFFGDMCGEENTAQAASVKFVRRRRTNYARSRLQPLCQKVLLFDSLSAAKSRRVKQHFTQRLAYGMQARITRQSALSH